MAKTLFVMPTKAEASLYSLGISRLRSKWHKQRAFSPCSYWTWIINIFTL